MTTPSPFAPRRPPIGGRTAPPGGVTGRRVSIAATGLDSSLGVIRAEKPYSGRKSGKSAPYSTPNMKEAHGTVCFGPPAVAVIELAEEAFRTDELLSGSAPVGGRRGRRRPKEPRRVQHESGVSKRPSLSIGLRLRLSQLACHLCAVRVPHGLFRHSRSCRRRHQRAGRALAGAHAAEGAERDRRRSPHRERSGAAQAQRRLGGGRRGRRRPKEPRRVHEHGGGSPDGRPVHLRRRPSERGFSSGTPKACSRSPDRGRRGGRASLTFASFGPSGTIPPVPFAEDAPHRASSGSRGIFSVGCRKCSKCRKSRVTHFLHLLHFPHCWK
jgi:hypothetical protein